jgi:hypothetical protein
VKAIPRQLVEDIIAHHQLDAGIGVAWGGGLDEANVLPRGGDTGPVAADGVSDCAHPIVLANAAQVERPGRGRPAAPPGGRSGQRS